MENFRRPSVGIPGVLSGLGQPAANASASATAAAPAAAALPTRDAAKINMLRRMRPPPLKYAWTFYHDKYIEGESYDHRQTLMLENIITLKIFWEAYNSFPLRALSLKDSVHFFKRGVKPVWEDRRNVTGGSWTFRVPKDKSEATWKEMLMLAIGEQFSEVIQRRDDLCGLTLSTRFNSDLIQIWTRDGNNTLTIDGILKVVLENLSPELKPKEGSFYYKKHSEHAGFAEAVGKASANVSAKVPSRMQEYKPEAPVGEELDSITEAEVQPDEAEYQQRVEDEEIIAKTPGLKEKFGF